MSQIESLNLTQMVKALIFDVQEEMIEIELFEDSKSLDYLGIRTTGFQKSSTIRIPLYFAIHLVKKGQAKFIDYDLNAILYNELKKQQDTLRLQILPDNLLAQSLSIISSQFDPQDSLDSPQNLLNIKKTHESFQNLLNERLKKILRELKVVEVRKIENKLDSLEKPLIKAVTELFTIFLTLLENYMQSNDKK